MDTELSSIVEHEYVTIGDLSGYYPDSYRYVKLIPGTILIDVIKGDTTTGVFFTVKNTGVRYFTNYGWAIGLNTEENLKLISDFYHLSELAETAAKKCGKAFDLIQTFN